MVQPWPRRPLINVQIMFYQLAGWLSVIRLPPHSVDCLLLSAQLLAKLEQPIRAVRWARPTNESHSRSGAAEQELEQSGQSGWGGAWLALLALARPLSSLH